MHEIKNDVLLKSVTGGVSYIIADYVSLPEIYFGCSMDTFLFGVAFGYIGVSVGLNYGGDTLAIVLGTIGTLSGALIGYSTSLYCGSEPGCYEIDLRTGRARAKL